MPVPAHAVLLSAGATAPATVSQAILALSPLGYWKLDEPSGTTATDSSGNGRNGTYTGSGYTLQGAAGGDGVNYVDLGNGASSHINIADNDVWSINNGTAGLSAFALLKPDDVSGTTPKFWLSKYAGGSQGEWGYDINRSVGGRFIMTLHTAAGGVIVQSGTTGSGGTATTSWQAVVVTVSGVAFSDVFLLYRNNNTNLATVITSASGTYANGTAPLRIGWRGDDPANNYWQGGIAHVALYDGVLTTTQVQTLMDAADNAGWF